MRTAALIALTAFSDDAPIEGLARLRRVVSSDSLIATKVLSQSRQRILDRDRIVGQLPL